MPPHRKRESWEQPAEELVRRLRDLLDNHWHAIEKALAKSMGKDKAASHLRQLDHFALALDVELWRKGDEPNRRIAGYLSGAALVLLTSLGAHAVELVTEDVHDAIVKSEAQAEEVLRCVVDERLSESLVEPAAANDPDPGATGSPAAFYTDADGKTYGIGAEPEVAEPLRSDTGRLDEHRLGSGSIDDTLDAEP